MNASNTIGAAMRPTSFLLIAGASFLPTEGDVSVGHGPGTPRNEGTAPDRGTPAPNSNLTEIDATQEPEKKHEKASHPSPSSEAKGGSPKAH